MNLRRKEAVAASILLVATSVYGQTSPEDDMQSTLTEASVMFQIEKDIEQRVKNTDCKKSSDTGGSMREQRLALQVCELQARVTMLQRYILPLLAEHLIATQQAFGQE